MLNVKPLHEYNFKIFAPDGDYPIEEHVCTVTPNYELRPKNTKAFLKYVTIEVFISLVV